LVAERPSDGRRDRWGEPQRRAIAAARQLAEEGGYDAVQIRDVVARTGLSSATIYRHFSSKDHLIAAAQLEWNRTLPRALQAVADGSGGAADRVAALLHQTCVAFGRAPNLARALVLSLGSADPGVRECRAEADALVLDTLREAIGDELPDPDVVLTPLALAWQGALFSWAHDHLTIEEVDERLREATLLLFAGAKTLVAGADGGLSSNRAAPPCPAAGSASAPRRPRPD
jgi:TetR/AcrR family transcriptional regulator, cholesterol catabolism regulator